MILSRMLGPLGQLLVITVEVAGMLIGSESRRDAETARMQAHLRARRTARLAVRPPADPTSVAGPPTCAAP